MPKDVTPVTDDQQPTRNEDGAVVARPKNIILLSDGTGNSASKLFKTSVWRLYQALDLREQAALPDQQPPQIAYYDDGVGTASFVPWALLTGAVGIGLKRNVLDLYTFLSRHYNRGDRIYCFGFSRGAFTIRVLTGLIASQGVLQKELPESVRRRLAADAFRAYRAARYPSDIWSLRGLLLGFFRSLRGVLLGLWYALRGRDEYELSKNRLPPPHITLLGLWDTVAAYGLPIDELTRAWNFFFPLSFPDHKLSPIVERACHALALDDERHSFHPELWNENPADYPPDNQIKPIAERLNQVWFAGMHTNVGGGYPDDGLAHVSLNWMLHEAEQADLHFKPDELARLRAASDLNGKLYDSRKGLGGYYRYMPRHVTTLTQAAQNNADKRAIIKPPQIHDSVFARIRNNVDGYAPIGLPQSYVVVTTPDGAAAAPLALVEHPTQREQRAAHQARVWNLVWWKRGVYFFTVAVSLLLAAFPLYRPATPACEGPFCALAPIISGLGSLLPDLLGGWFNAYQSHPGTLLLLTGLLVVALYLSSQLQLRIFAKMRATWRSIMRQPGVPVTPPPAQEYRLHKWLAPVFKWLKTWLLIPLLTLAILLLLLMGLARILFNVRSTTGFACQPTTSARLINPGRPESFSFKNDALCWASGLQVERGKSYRLTLALDNPAQWIDGQDESAVATDPHGYSREAMTLWHYLGLPLRRHLQEPWFKPIARIGARGSDEYPLDFVGTATSHEFVTVLTARRAGELFLFVNDAVLPAWQPFYKNNQGAARVTLQLIE